MNPSIETWVRKCVASAREGGDLVFRMHEPWPPELDTTGGADRVLARLVQVFPECKGVIIGGMMVSNESVKALGMHAKHFTDLQEVQLCGDYVDDDNVRALAAQAKHLSNIKTLKLRSTSVGDNGVKALAGQARHFSKLQVLWLYGKHIGDAGLKALVAEAQHFPNLQVLQLVSTFVGDEALKALAVALEAGSFPRFEILDLSDTSIADEGLKALAAQASHLSNLQELSLSWTSVGDDGLKALAAQGHSVPNLRKLTLGSTHVGDNGLNALVSAALRLPKLTHLELGGARTTLPEELLVSNDAQAIFKYVRERRASGAGVLGEIKLLVVGQPKTGKTHLVKRLFGNTGINPAYFNFHEERTHDVGRCEIDLDWPVALPKGPGKLKVRVWDFGGQNELHSTHRFFLGCQRCFYMLVLRADRQADGEEPDDNRLSYWLRMIAHYGQTSNARAPVIIAVTHCDRVELSAEAKQAFDNLMAALAEAKAQAWHGANVVVEPIVGLGWSDDVKSLSAVKASDLENANQQACERLVEAIQQNVASVPDIAELYPETFFAFRGGVNKSLSSPGADGEIPYFDMRTHSDFQELCDQKNINIGQVQLYLSILNSLGVVHWIGDVEEVKQGTDTLLQQRVFNPEWVLRPIYELIRFQSNKPGIITNDELERQLPMRCEGDTNGKYLYQRLPFTKEHRNNILALMRACRLAYDNKNPGGWLVPDLLTTIPVNESERHQPPFVDVLAVRMEAEFLPEKIFLRLLADWYDLIARPNKECFRNEVQFLIDVQGQKLPVLVRPIYSPPSGQRPYLEVVVANEEERLRDQAVVRVDQKISDVFRKERLPGWIGVPLRGEHEDGESVQPQPDQNLTAPTKQQHGKGVGGNGYAMTIERWSELAIGVHVPPGRGFEYYGFSPPPSCNSIVFLRDATLLDLPGKRWPKVLDCFAKSADGRSASKDDLFALLFPDHLARTSAMKPGDEDEDLQGDGNEEQNRKRGRKQKDRKPLSTYRMKSEALNDSMSDLGAKLRRVVKCLEKQVPPFQGKRSLVYQSAFTIGFIVKGADGQLRFRPKF